MNATNQGVKSTLLMSLMCVALAACGGGGGSTSAAGTTAVASSSAASTAATSSKASSVAASSGAAASTGSSLAASSQASTSATNSSAATGVASSSAATSSVAASSMASSATASSKASSAAASSVATSSVAASSVASSAAASSVTVSTTAGGYASPVGGGLPVYDAAGNITGSTLATARVKYATTFTEMNSIITTAKTGVKTGDYPLLIVYSGNEDALIAQIVADSTIDAAHNCVKGHWGDTYREVPLKDYTAGITIIGTNGSSANFGITIVNAGNVIVRNMKIGALGGASNDADMLRIDNSSNVWIDHNELFAVNNECNGSPDGDLTFESALDIKKNAQNITVSYNYIHDSKKVGLDGHTQSSGGTTDFQRTITFHHNIYYNVNGRLPLQRGGWTHMYNNFYDKITSSGINVRAKGYALIEKNWFQNSLNPVTCRYDTDGCGYWDLRGNNLTSSADNATYGITWDTDGGKAGTLNADTWITTAVFPITLPYTYTAETPQCVKDNLVKVAGVSKGFAALTCN